MSRKAKPVDNPMLPEWRTFEQAVAAVQKMLSADAIVRHNEHIVDMTGSQRQFDVTIRGEWAGLPALGVVECKRKSRPVGKHEIEAFHTKAQSVNANFKVIVSRNGFYKDALKHAKYYNVGAMSLLDQGSQTSFALSGPAYASIYSWSEIHVIMYFTEGQNYSEKFDPIEILYGGNRVIDWFLKELSTTHVAYKESGCLSCDVQFDRPIEISIRTYTRIVKAIKFIASRKILKKTKIVNWTGDAFYDWHKKKLIWPAGGILSPNFIINNSPGGQLLEDWDDYAGELPDNSPGLLSIIMNFYKPVIDLETPVIDLTSL